MRLVLLGYFGFGNAGDEAILAAEVQALRTSLGTDTEFVVVSGDVEHTARVHGLPAVGRTDFPGVLRALRSCDGLVAGGGSLLQDVTSARPVSFYGGVMLAAKALRKPVFVYAQGLGPIGRPVNRWLGGRALRAASYLALRDDASRELAQSLGATSCELVPDPVLGLERPLSGEGSGLGSGLAVSLRPWHDSAAWLPLVTAALRTLATEVEVTLVPFHETQDLELARTVATELGSAAELVEPTGDFRTVLSAVAGARAVLGMRLHALVAAAAAGRPFVALSYDPKVTAFAEQVGQPVAATLPGTLDPDELASEVRTALTGPTSAYAKTLDILRAAAHEPADRIAAHYVARGRR